MMRPARGGVSPRIERISVVLPEPFEPSRQVMRPGSTVSETPSQHVGLVIGRGRPPRSRAARHHAPPRDRLPAPARSAATCAIRALGDLAAEIEHDAAVGDALDHAHLVLDDDDRQVLVALADQQDVVHQLAGFVVRHAGRRLVQQQQPGLADQRAADLDAAAVDHRQARDRLEHARRQAAARTPRAARAPPRSWPRTRRLKAPRRIRLNHSPCVSRLWLPIMMLSKIDSGSDSRERWKVREMPAL